MGEVGSELRVPEPIGRLEHMAARKNGKAHGNSERPAGATTPSPTADLANGKSARPRGEWLVPTISVVRRRRRVVLAAITDFRSLSGNPVTPPQVLFHAFFFAYLSGKQRHFGLGSPRWSVLRILRNTLCLHRQTSYFLLVMSYSLKRALVSWLCLLGVISSLLEQVSAHHVTLITPFNWRWWWNESRKFYLNKEVQVVSLSNC